MELVRQKNVATYIVFPIVDADGDLVSSAAGLDSEIDTFGDGTAPDGFVDCTNEATEIGSTGMYYLSLAQSEMNHDYIVLQVKTTTSGAKTQVILIRTMVGDPLNIGTTDDGGTINVASGIVESNVKQLNGSSIQQASGYIKVSEGTGTGQLDLTSGRPGVDWAKVSNPTNATGLTNTTVGTVTTNSDMRGTDSALLASSAPANFGDLAITATTGKMTVGANDDKTGYSISGTKQTLDALNDPAAADIADAVWDEASTGHTDAGKAGAQLWTDIDAILTDTSEVQGKLPANYIMGSSAQFDKDDEIDAIKTVADKLNDTVEDDAGVYRFTANALEEAPTGSGASAADIADAVWNETSTGHTDAGKAGAQLWTEIDDVLTDTDEIQSLISNSKIAAQIKGMDANTLTGSALASDAVNKIRDAIMDATVDGSIDVGKCLKAVLAVLAGDMANVNNTYMYKDQSDTTLVTEVVGESAVERAIA
jgi:hypothetical protein